VKRNHHAPTAPSLVFHHFGVVKNSVKNSVKIFSQIIETQETSVWCIRIQSLFLARFRFDRGGFLRSVIRSFIISIRFFAWVAQPTALVDAVDLLGAGYLRETKTVMFVGNKSPLIHINFTEGLPMKIFN